VSEKTRLELELNDLKDYMLKVHSQFFKQAICQAVLLYGIPEQNEMDENKDVYNRRLVSIEEILAPTTPEAILLLKVTCLTKRGRPGP